MKAVTPYLFFNGNCRQAMEFYKKCFGGELHLMTYGDAPKDACASGMPAFPKDKIMHSKLQRGDFTVLASDSSDGSVSSGEQVQLCIECTSQDEIEKLFAALSEKGKVEMPLSDTFWGARFGTLTDQFGIGWMLNFQKSGS